MGVGDSVDIDNQAVGVGEQEGGILLDVVDIEDDAGELRRNLRGADAGEKAALGDEETFAGEVGGKVRVVEIEVNAVRVLDASGFKLDRAGGIPIAESFVSEIDGDAGVSGGGPVTDACDQRDGRSGGDWLEVRRGLGERRQAADSGERRSEDDAAERICTAGAHAKDSLGLRRWEGEGNRGAGA